VDAPKGLLAHHPRLRVNLPAVAAALAALQRGFHRRAEELGARDPIDDRVIANMLAGYAFVDALVGDGIDVLAMGSLKHLLEMNTLVLCGTSPDLRDQHAGHIEATERRFYEEPDGGIRDVVEWYAGHRADPVWDRAAGTYVRMLSKPQLFIEGNHRTGALMMSYLLLRDGRPPFVLGPDDAPVYFGGSRAIRDVDKRSPIMRFRLSSVAQSLAKLLQEQSDPALVLP